MEENVVKILASVVMVTLCMAFGLWMCFECGSQNNNSSCKSHGLTELAKEEDLNTRRQQVEEHTAGLSREKASGGIKTLVPNEDSIFLQFHHDDEDNCPYVSMEQIVLRAIVSDLEIRRQQVECDKEALNGLAIILSK